MNKVYDLIIVGGGPAGMAAGIYASRQKLKTLLITKSFGGQMTRKSVAIENWPGIEEISGLELIQRFEKHLKKQQIDIEKNTVRKVKKINKIFSVLTSDKQQFQSKAVIISSGADPRPLEVLGEKKFIGRGVSYCVACDGPLFAGKEVAVVGGGNAGFEAALALSAYAKKIYILEFSPKPGADEMNQKNAKKIEKIKVLTNTALKRIQGKTFVDSIVYQDRTSKTELPKEAKVKMRTKFSSPLKTLNVQGIFVEIGSQPATSFVKDLVEFNEKDEIIVDPKTAMTKTPGLFSAGDVEDVPYKQIVIACGEGAKAALAVSEYLQKQK